MFKNFSVKKIILRLCCMLRIFLCGFVPKKSVVKINDLCQTSIIEMLVKNRNFGRNRKSKMAILVKYKSLPKVQISTGPLSARRQKDDPLRTDKESLTPNLVGYNCLDSSIWSHTQ